MRNLVVDGIFEDGTFQADGELPPFVIFDADRQENIDGPYTTRWEAERAREGIINLGREAKLDVEALGKMLDKIDADR